QGRTRARSPLLKPPLDDPAEFASPQARMEPRRLEMCECGRLVVGAAYYRPTTPPRLASPPTPPTSNQTGIVSPLQILNSGKCAGQTDFLSFVVDYRPVKRVAVYAGVMESNVYAGLANGYWKTQNIAPTAGIRIKF